MGQKTNPTALRLEKTNQHFKACWYGNYFYSDQLHNNFKIRDYICKIFYRINGCTPLIYIKNGHQSNQILCFFPKKPRKRIKNFRKKRSTPLPVRRSPTKKWSAFFGAALENNIRKPISNTQTKLWGEKNLIYTNLLSTCTPEVLPTTTSSYPVEKLFYVHNSLAQDRVKVENPTHPSKGKMELSTLLLSIFHKQSCLLLSAKKRNSSVALSRASMGGPRNSRPSTKIKHKIQIENTININNFSLFTNLQKKGCTSKMYTSLQSAMSGDLPLPMGNMENKCTDKKVNTFWDSIPKVPGAPFKTHHYHCYPLGGKKTSLYPIKVSKVQQNSDFLAQRIESNLKKRVTYNRLRRQILRDVVKSPFIKGIRVTLSGRVNSKSKKAQKARTNTFHWGQTELHVYSSLVQFTNSHLITPFGKIGIKVWMCYHS